MKLIYEITVFSLISTVGGVLIGGQRLKEGRAYFKVKEIHQIEFQNFCFCSFQQ